MVQRILAVILPVFIALTLLLGHTSAESSLTPNELKQIRLYDDEFDDRTQKTIIAGPATVSLNDIAVLNLPENYIYAEDIKTYGRPLENISEFTCARYISLRNSNKNRLCIKIANVGYLRLSDDLSLLKDRAEQLQVRIPPKRLWTLPKTIDFSWMHLPEYNSQAHTLTWAYRYVYDNKTLTYERPESFADQEISAVMFGQQHIIWLTNGDYYGAEKFQPQLADWVNKISFNTAYQYQENQVPACHDLAPNDSALEGIAYDYSADPERCFPYPLEYLISSLPERSDGNMNIHRFVSRTREARKVMWIKQSY
ncbi:TPA: hypothetical protein MYO83_003453 [Klebsiella michiganensis]|nr:hypothetical protein [Klebsiella michiganensis]HCB1846743.1 hypothetical protein [Klebsiella oxytoca]